MKATIDFEEHLYRRLKVEAARRGQTIRELVEDGVRYVLELPAGDTSQQRNASQPEWIGTLRKYAGNAGGEHDLPAIRASIAKGKQKRP